MSDLRGAKHVGRALLFERLVAEPEVTFGEPTRYLPEPRRAHDVEGLRASVLREVTNILNTRCSFTALELEGRTRTAIDYGIPAVEPRHERGSDRYIARIVRQAIEAYEPRLRNVDVHLLGPDAVAERTARFGGSMPMPGEVLARITGELATEDVREPLSFDVPVALGEGRAR